MDISLIILNYKNKGLIKQQLKHWYAHPSRLQTEVIVVDNDSHDNIGQMIAQDFPKAVFIASSVNGGFAAGNNLGIARATGKYIMVVNPDIVLTGKSVDALYDFMEAHQDVGIAGPKLINADGSIQYSCLRFPDMWLPLFRRTFFAATRFGKKWLANYFMEEWDHAEARDVDWLFGACLIVRRSALDAVGMLDDRFFLYLEDTDWCRRFWEKHWKVFYVPHVQVIHLLRRSSEGSLLALLFNKTTRIHLMSFAKYMRKYWRTSNPHSSLS